MLLSINQRPLAKTRPRFYCQRGTPRVYEIQTEIMKKLGMYFNNQMHDKGYLKADEGPIMINLTAYMPKPKSWSKKRSKQSEGNPVVTKPDIDNIYKIYSDVLTGIAYRDDSQVFRCLSQKIYSDKPRVEIEILPLGNEMVNEHAKVVSQNINLQDLEYLVKKANRLGESGRKIYSVHSEKDLEGWHIYFVVQGLKERIIV